MEYRLIIIYPTPRVLERRRLSRLVDVILQLDFEKDFLLIH